MRINCGGFELNENDFELDGETLSLKNSGSISDLPLVVTIYADDAVDGENELSVDVTFKMNKTFNEILNAHNNNRIVLFTFESINWSPSITSINRNAKTTFVLHNNHSTIMSDGMAFDDVEPNIPDIMVASESLYNEYKGVDDNLLSILFKQWMPSFVGILVNQNSYEVHLTFDDLPNFEGSFSCSDPDECPSVVISLIVSEK